MPEDDKLLNRLGELNGKLDNIFTHIENLENVVKDLSSEVKTINSKMAEISKEVGKLETEISHAKEGRIENRENIEKAKKEAVSETQKIWNHFPLLKEELKKDLKEFINIVSDNKSERVKSWVNQSRVAAIISLIGVTATVILSLIKK